MSLLLRFRPVFRSYWLYEGYIRPCLCMHVSECRFQLISLYSLKWNIKRQRVCILLSSRWHLVLCVSSVDPVFVTVGGLAVEKLGKLSARGPWRGDADAEKASPEHAHLRPSPAKEHEVEAPGPAGRKLSPPMGCAPSRAASIPYLPLCPTPARAL